MLGVSVHVEGLGRCYVYERGELCFGERGEGDWISSTLSLYIRSLPLFPPFGVAERVAPLANRTLLHKPVRTVLLRSSELEP